MQIIYTVCKAKIIYIIFGIKMITKVRFNFIFISIDKRKKPINKKKNKY